MRQDEHQAEISGVIALETILNQYEWINDALSTLDSEISSALGASLITLSHLLLSDDTELQEKYILECTLYIFIAKNDLSFLIEFNHAIQTLNNFNALNFKNFCEFFQLPEPSLNDDQDFDIHQYSGEVDRLCNPEYLFRFKKLSFVFHRLSFKGIITVNNFQPYYAFIKLHLPVFFDIVRMLNDVFLNEWPDLSWINDRLINQEVLALIEEILRTFFQLGELTEKNIKTFFSEIKKAIDGNQSLAFSFLPAFLEKLYLLDFFEDLNASETIKSKLKPQDENGFINYHFLLALNIPYSRLLEFREEVQLNLLTINYSNIDILLCLQENFLQYKNADFLLVFDVCGNRSFLALLGELFQILRELNEFTYQSIAWFADKIYQAVIVENLNSDAVVSQLRYFYLQIKSLCFFCKGEWPDEQVINNPSSFRLLMSAGISASYFLSLPKERQRDWLNGIDAKNIRIMQYLCQHRYIILPEISRNALTVMSEISKELENQGSLSEEYLSIIFMLLYAPFQVYENNLEGHIESVLINILSVLRSCCDENSYPVLSAPIALFGSTQSSAPVDSALVANPVNLSK